MTTIEAPISRELAEPFLRKPHQLLIGGKWVDSATGKTMATTDPATEELLCEVSQGGEEDIDRAVRAARKAFDYNAPWRRMAPSERARIIHRIGDLVLEHRDELALLETLDNGKPITLSRAFADVTAEVFHYMSGWATKTNGSTVPLGQDLLGFTQKEPVGVVGLVTAWNAPLLICAWKLGPLLAAGCTAVMKPAEQTPLVALRLGELMQEAGLPDGVVNIVNGLGDAGAALCAHPDVDKVSFTGSTGVGKKIINASAGNLKKLTLELGGKSPNIVFDDADLPTAIQAAGIGIFSNQGQVCCAGSRLFVQRGVYDEVVAGVSDYAKGLTIGSGLDPATEMGPLVSEAQMKTVLGFLESGNADGAVATAGGQRRGMTGYFVEPTVLTQTRPDMSVVKDEIFGPVVVAIPFDDPSEIIDAANDTPFGLAAGIFTRDISKAYRTAAQIKAGTVWVNTYHLLVPELPFGGYKQSGWGRELGYEAVEGHLETKSVITQL